MSDSGFNDVMRAERNRVNRIEAEAREAYEWERRQSAADVRATRRLIANHRAEFDRLCSEEAP